MRDPARLQNLPDSCDGAAFYGSRMATIKEKYRIPPQFKGYPPQVGLRETIPVPQHQQGVCELQGFTPPPRSQTGPDPSMAEVVCRGDFITMSIVVPAGTVTGGGVGAPEPAQSSQGKRPREWKDISKN